MKIQITYSDLLCDNYTISQLCLYCGENIILNAFYYLYNLKIYASCKYNRNIVLYLQLDIANYIPCLYRINFKVTALRYPLHENCVFLLA